MSLATREVRHVVRKLSRAPGFTVIAILTLAIGVGANTAIFSVVDGVLLRPLPYPDAGELVMMWHTAPGIGIEQFEQSNTTYTLYREHALSFDEIGLVRPRALNLAGTDEPIRVNASGATASVFRLLRVPTHLGRTFTEEEDDPGGPRVAVLSYELWNTRFGAAPDIVGLNVTLNGESHEIIGVMASGFRYPNDETDVWVPHVIRPEELGETNFSFWGIGRLRPGVTVAAASDELNAIIPRMPEEYPGEITAGMMEQAQFAAYVNPLKENVVGDVGRVLWILLGTVSFVLLIAIANVANLFLVRAEGRQREMAVRTALGAGRGDVVRAFLAESTVLSLIGGIAGIGLALLGVRLLVSLGPDTLPRLGEIGVNGGVLLFTGAVSLIAGLLFGAVPALKYGRPNLGIALKEGGRGGSAGRDTHRANNALVSAQVALALMLLIGSSLMARSFFELRDVDPGFDTEGVLTLRLSMIPGDATDAATTAAFFQELLDNLRGIPGVIEAGGATSLPFNSWSNNAMTMEDRPLGPDEIPPIVRTDWAAPGYFEAIGIPLIEGRTLERQDNEQRTGAAVISRTLAEQHWPGESAIGKRVGPGLASMYEGEVPWFTIVGIVGDVRDDGLAEDPPGMLYYSLVGREGLEEPAVISTLSLAIRTRGEPMALLPVVRSEIWALDPRLPIANVRTSTDLVRQASARTSFTLVMLGIAAAVALLLGTIGVYGVISYTVSQRTREFGIRMAMGAADGNIRGMVVRQGLRVAAIGVAVGLIGGFALTRLMQTLLFGVSATDPLTFGAVAVSLLGVSALASYLPARRAASVDPSDALRYE